VNPEGLNADDPAFSRMTINDRQLSEFRKLNLGVVKYSTIDTVSSRNYFYKEEYLSNGDKDT